MFTMLHKLVSVRVALVLALLAGVFGVLPVYATPSIAFGWAKNMGGTNLDSGYAMAIDGGGNVYTTGIFSGTADFDPGAGIHNLTSVGSYDIFISKLDVNGNFVWAKSMGGTGYDLGGAIAVDVSGNLYITGSFSGTADFNPGIGTYNLTSAGESDIFINKLDSNGNFIGRKSSAGLVMNSSRAVAVDSNGNLLITGYFSDVVDFDPGVGMANYNSTGGTDIFLSKLDSSGNFIWTKAVGGTGDDYGEDIAIDSNGNIHITGYFVSTVDFDPGIGVVNLTSAGSLGETDIFVSKLDTNGNLLWAKGMGGSIFDYGYEIVVSGNGSVYTTGLFSGTADFDPGAGTYELTSAGSYDIFVSKLDANGGFVWAKPMGGIGIDRGASIALDGSENVHTTGYFKETVDFDPGTGTVNLTSVGLSDFFVSRLDSNGNFVWVKAMGGTGDDGGNAIEMDGNGNVRTAGYFEGTVDFDPGVNTYSLTSAGLGDIFVTKLTVTPQIHYVKSNAGGLDNGSSWANAYTDLQSALSAASSGDEIWVAAGTYKPTTGADRTISFTLKNGVAIYGGFAGTETLRTQRNPSTNVTVLSGEIGTAWTSDNSYHVVVGSSTNNSTVLNGFTITAGNANGTSPNNYGGGMYNTNGANLKLSNLVFSNNSAYGGDGGGMYNDASSPTLTDVTFTANSASRDGGGMYNSSYSNATLTNVTFSANAASYTGGGMFNFNSSPTLTNVTFSGNSALGGGGMYNYSNSSTTLTNVTFSANSADYHGGGMLTTRVAPR